MKSKRRGKIITGVIAVLVVLALVAAVYAVRSRRSGPPEVEAMKLAPGKIVSSVAADGELKALNQVDISAEVVAKVAKVYVEEGDQVEKGRLLCVLDDDEYRSRRDLNLAQFEKAKSAYERGKQLFEENLIAAAEFEDRRTTYEVARAELEQSEEDLRKTRIYAPISGRVVRMEIEAGETVMMGTTNNAGTVMLTLGDLSALQAEVYVDEADVVRVVSGQPAELTFDALPDQTFDARVSTISYMPTVDTSSEATGVTEFEVTLDLVETAPSLRPGMSVTAEIITAVKDDVLTCPLQALGQEEVGGRVRDTVFVVANGRVKIAAVETGVSDGVRTEIKAGLKKGQVVVVGPYKTLRLLEDGDEVKVVEREKGWPKKNGTRPSRAGAGDRDRGPTAR